METYQVSERRACRVVGLSRSVYRYQPKRPDDRALANQLHALAAAHPRWGYRKMHDYLRNQGWRVNHKRVRRVYRARGLHLRVKPKKRLPKRNPQPLVVPAAPHQSWAVDFMSDSLLGGRSFRTFNVLDEFNRQALWIELDTSLPAGRIRRVLDQLADCYGYPAQIRSDNGPELISRELATWAATHQVKQAFIEPGRPAQNAFMERFNRTYREEVLDLYAFSSLTEARFLTEQWLEQYNAIRPHAALGGLTPLSYAAQHAPETVHF